MAAYHISVHSCVDDTGELHVLLKDEDACEMGILDALSIEHARLIARDLMTLVRQRDPAGAFVLDTHIVCRGQSAEHRAAA